MKTETAPAAAVLSPALREAIDRLVQDVTALEQIARHLGLDLGHRELTRPDLALLRAAASGPDGTVTT